MVEFLHTWWPQLSGLGGVLAVMLGGLYTIMNGQVGHWQGLHEAKQKDLAAAKADLAEAERKLNAAQAQIDDLKGKLAAVKPLGQIRRFDDLPGLFVQLVQQYRSADDVSNEKERSRIKDELALKLGWFALGAKIPRDTLVQFSNPGCVVAVCEKIVAEPRPGDGLRLERVGNYGVPPHTRHRIMNAIKAAARAGMLDPKERPPLLQMLNRFEAELGQDEAADVHLAKINELRSSI